MRRILGRVRASRACLVVAALAGCHPKPAYVGVRATDVSAHLDEMRTAGSAELPTVVVDRGPPEPGPLETVFLYQTVKIGALSASLEALSAGCPSTDPTSCALARYADRPLILRELPRDRRREGRPNRGPTTVMGLFALGALGGMVYCIAECTSNRAEKSLGLGAAAAVLGLVTYVLAGGTLRD